MEQILRHSPEFHITIFGDETHVNYSRIQLSAVLAGEKEAENIVLNGLDWYRENSIDLRLGVRITGVDPIARTVTGDDGSVTPYDKLLLATGSSPLIPPISGSNKEGVFCFRNLDEITRAENIPLREGRAVNAGWATALVKAVLCNWMVTVGALLAMASRSTIGKIAAMWLPILTFFAQGFEHSIVNMFVVPTGMLLKAPVSFGNWWLWNQVPVTIGNIVSGSLFTGLALYSTFRAKPAPQPAAASAEPQLAGAAAR